jgi:hypothetical protein
MVAADKPSLNTLVDVLCSVLSNFNQMWRAIQKFLYYYTMAPTPPVQGICICKKTWFEPCDRFLDSDNRVPPICS